MPGLIPRRSVHFHFLPFGAALMHPLTRGHRQGMRPRRRALNGSGGSCIGCWRLWRGRGRRDRGRDGGGWRRAQIGWARWRERHDEAWLGLGIWLLRHGARHRCRGADKGDRQPRRKDLRRAERWPRAKGPRISGQGSSGKRTQKPQTSLTATKHYSTIHLDLTGRSMRPRRCECKRWRKGSIYGAGVASFGTACVLVKTSVLQRIFRMQPSISALSPVILSGTTLKVMS